MTLWVLLAAGAVLVWAWKTGQLRALRYGDVAAAVGGVLALRLLSKGQVAVGVAGLAVVVIWIALRRRAIPPALAMPVDEARGVLDLPPDADRDAIQEAHRRLIARVHPDAGGSEELARRVNAARDVLLADLNQRAPRAS